MSDGDVIAAPKGRKGEAKMNTIDLPPEWKRPAFRRKDAAAYLGVAYGITVAPQTLARWACEGGGPKFHKPGFHPVYPRAALDEWAREKLGPLVSSTSELIR